MAALVALAMIGATTPNFGTPMSVVNIPASRNVAGRAFGFMPTSKHVRKTNKLRCKHNAKLKRRLNK